MDEIIKLAKELYPGSDIESRYNRVVAVEVLSRLEDERKMPDLPRNLAQSAKIVYNLINL